MDQSYGLPGIKTEVTATPRKVMASRNNVVLLPGGVIIEGAYSRDPLNTSHVDRLRAGIMMGKSSGGKFRPTIIGALTTAEAASQTTLGISAATATELTRRVGATGQFLLVGPTMAGNDVVKEIVVYSAITVNGASSTITCTAITSSFMIGALIMANDGTDYPLGIIDDGFPIKVTDEDGSNIDVYCPRLAVGGIVDESQIVSFPTDQSTAQYLRDQISAPGVGLWIFDNVFTGATVADVPTPTPTATPTPTPT